MDRKEFLLQLWEKYFRPALVIAASLLVIKFFIQDFETVTLVGTILIYAVALLVLLAVIAFPLNFINRLFGRLYDRLPAATKKQLFIANCLFEYFLTLGSGVMIYFLWQKDWFYTSVLLACVIASRVRGIVAEMKKEKLP